VVDWVRVEIGNSFATEVVDKLYPLLTQAHQSAYSYRVL
jgi:hypothetical protein